MKSNTGKLSAVNAPTPPERTWRYSGRVPANRSRQCDSAAHHMSGKPGSTVPVGYGSTSNVLPSRDRRGATLDARAVGLEVDPPRLVGDQTPIVVAQRLVGVEVDHRRGAAVGGHERGRIDRELTLLEVPVGPHRLVGGHAAIGLVDVEPIGQPEHRPQRGDPRSDRDHDLLDLDRAGARLHRAHGSGVVELKAGHLDPAGDLGARRPAPCRPARTSTRG